MFMVKTAKCRQNGTPVTREVVAIPPQIPQQAAYWDLLLIAQRAGHGSPGGLRRLILNTEEY